MSANKNGYVQVIKCYDVRGRIRYTTDPKRQEHLYATYTNVPQKFWYYLAKTNQRDFKASGTEGKCIEARELIIMLPPSLIEYDHDMLLQYITGRFIEKYDVGCIAALHHNKAMTNLHVHLTFSERQSLDEVERKVASRNMFYQEDGRHVRTKKEILDEHGNIREGCKVIKKGEVYETNFFKPKNQEFKSKKFTEEIKVFFMNICNELSKNENEKLKVFNRNGPYLATKKVGKNNPKAKEILEDNGLRKDWNNMVDRALIVGVKEEKVMEVKKKEISTPVKESIQKYEREPGLFRLILRGAIEVLRMIIDKIRKKPEPVVEIPSQPKPQSIKLPKERPSTDHLEKQLDWFEGVQAELEQLESEITALEKKISSLKQKYGKVSTGILNYKKRKELSADIQKAEINLKSKKSALEVLPQNHGYPNLKLFYDNLEELVEKIEYTMRIQEKWDANQEILAKQEHEKEKTKPSIREQLKQSQKEIENIERTKQRKPKVKKRSSWDMER